MFPRTKGAFPRNEESFRRRLVRVVWAFLRNEGCSVIFREIQIRMGVIIFEMHCTSVIVSII